MDRFGAPNWVYRFDVVGVIVTDGKARIRHLPDAFDLRTGH
jgi:hypothetical protein